MVFVMLPIEMTSRGRKQTPVAPYRQVMREVATSCRAPVVDLPKAFARDGRPHLFLDEMAPASTPAMPIPARP